MAIRAPGAVSRLLILLLVAASAGASEAAPRGAGASAPLPPGPEGTCPLSHPLKATVGRATGECVYHVPGGPHYRRTVPEFCFASERDARLQDCWRAEEVL